MADFHVFTLGNISGLAIAYTILRFYAHYDRKKRDNYIPPPQATWRD